MRSASAPRTPVPREERGGVDLDRRCGRRATRTSSPAAMRCASPRTTLVLPTPGQPDEARAVAVALGEHVERALDLRFAPDDRVELAPRRRGGQVAADLTRASGSASDRARSAAARSARRRRGRRARRSMALAAGRAAVGRALGRAARAGDRWRGGTAPRARQVPLGGGLGRGRERGRAVVARRRQRELRRGGHAPRRRDAHGELHRRGAELGHVRSRTA